jgi:hypothetical protein
MNSSASLLSNVPRGALQLATLASLAARIEPQLLRTLRLELGTDLSASDEADLWFSGLVAMSAATGIVLRDDAADELRLRLARNKDALEAAWQITRAVHAGNGPILLAEEELTFLALKLDKEVKGQAATGVYRRSQDLLLSLLSTLRDASRQADLSYWMSRAIWRLPASLFELPEARILAGVTAVRSRQAPKPERLPDPDLHAIIGQFVGSSSIPALPMGVRAVAGAVEFGPPSPYDWHPIAVPDIRPLSARLVWGRDRLQHNIVSLDPRTTKTSPVPSGVETVEIWLADGSAYKLSLVSGDWSGASAPLVGDEPPSPPAFENRRQEALQILREEVLPILIKLGAVKEVAFVKEQLASILQTSDQSDEALRIRREEVLPILRRLGAMREIALVQEQVAAIIEMHGHFEEARSMMNGEVLPIVGRFVIDDPMRITQLINFSDNPQVLLVPAGDDQRSVLRHAEGVERVGRMREAIRGDGEDAPEPEQGQ